MEPGVSYYDSRNKIESDLLATSYVTEVVGWSGTASNTPVVKYTRTRTKNYQYVGLSKSAAKQCVKDKTAQYTRIYWQWIQKSSGTWHQDRTSSGRYTDQVANIQAQRQDGGLWTVQIQVNEIAVVYLFGYSSNLDNTFRGYLGDWDYDED